MVRQRWMLLLYLCGLPSLAAAHLSAELDKSASTLGEPLQLRVRSERDLAELNLDPLAKQFEIFSRANASSSEHGRTHYTLDLTLYPLFSGKLDIPSLQLGQEHTRALTLEVQPSAVTMQAAVAPQVPMEREPTLLTLAIRDDGNLNWDLPQYLDAPHVGMRKLAEMQQEENGSVLHTFRWRLLPLQGDNASVRFGMLEATKFGQRLRFPMPILSFPVRPAPAYLPLQIPVGRPQLQAAPVPQRVVLGQPVAWPLEIAAPGLSAEGALKLLQYTPPPHLKFYQPEVATLTREDGSTALRITLTFVAARGARQFPSMQFPFFDPQQQRLETLALPAQPLQVRDPLWEQAWHAGMWSLLAALLIFLAYRLRPTWQRWRQKRAWLKRIRAAHDLSSLYRALTADTPWRALTLQQWPTPLTQDLRTQLEQARFGRAPATAEFSTLRGACHKACKQLPLPLFPTQETRC